MHALEIYEKEVVTKKYLMMSFSRLIFRRKLLLSRWVLRVDNFPTECLASFSLYYLVNVYINNMIVESAEMLRTVW